MSTYSMYEKVLAEARRLPREDQSLVVKELITDLLLVIGEPGTGKTMILRELAYQILKRTSHDQTHSSQENTEPLYDIREFRGIGHGTWEALGGVDEFIRQERASWDD